MVKQFLLIVPISVLCLFVPVADASNVDGDYHWGRTTNSFTLELGDNVSSSWDSYLKTASNDWSVSTVLDTVVKTGKTKPRTCTPTVGRVEVCSEKYGNTGWLGLTQLWVSGDHIIQATVKLNDTYFSTKTYNTAPWRNSVMCHELGHVLGLDHQDEDFHNTNIGSCLDFTNNPKTNQRPNKTDYGSLESIYGHLDSSDTIIGPITGGVARGFYIDNTKMHDAKKDIELHTFIVWK